MRPVLSWLAVLLAVVISVQPGFSAPLRECFSSADADAYVEAAVRTLGDGEATVSDKDYAVRLLQALDSGSVATGYKSSACVTASAGLDSGDLAGIHYGISLRAGVGCPGEVSAEVSGVIEQAMQVGLFHEDGGRGWVLLCVPVFASSRDFTCRQYFLIPKDIFAYHRHPVI